MENRARARYWVPLLKVFLTEISSLCSITDWLKRARICWSLPMKTTFTSMNGELMANVRRSCLFAFDISRLRDSVKNLLKSIQVFLILIIEWEPITLCEMCEKCSNKANEHELMNSLWVVLRRKALNFLTSKVSVPHWLEACKRFQVTITRSSRSTTAPLSGQCELVGVGKTHWFPVKIHFICSVAFHFHQQIGPKFHFARWTCFHSDLLGDGLSHMRERRKGRRRWKGQRKGPIFNRKLKNSQNWKLYWKEKTQSNSEKEIITFVDSLWFRRER